MPRKPPSLAAAGAAARGAEREADVVIVGQGADRLVHGEIRDPASRLIGSTAYMLERYGKKLLELALKILHGESVPPAVYMNHVFIAAENIDQFYPVADRNSASDTGHLASQTKTAGLN